MLRSVAAVLIDDLDPFEFGVLCETFGFDRTDEGVPPVEFMVCGERPGEPLTTGLGFTVTPTHGLDAAARADLVAFPAALRRSDYPPAVLDTFRAAYERGAMLLSLCSGAFLLAEAGLLDGKRCTTHWKYAAEFAERFPAVELDPHVLYVDDGGIVTSAGSAAGLDACMHLMRREMGSAAAAATARRMVMPAQRDGGQRQFVDLPVPVCTGDSLQPILEWMMENLPLDHTVSALAKRAAMSERTFARRFVAETGTTPHKWLTMQRVLHARRLLEDTAFSVDEVALRCGFGTSALLRHHFNQVVGVPPSDYRRTFAARPA